MSSVKPKSNDILPFDLGFLTSNFKYRNDLTYKMRTFMTINCYNWKRSVSFSWKITCLWFLSTLIGFIFQCTFIQNFRFLSCLFMFSFKFHRHVTFLFIRFEFEKLIEYTRDHPHITSAKRLDGWGQKKGNFC